MFLLMLAREWEELEIATSMGNRIRITGYAMPMDGGGRMPTSGFMPLFRTYEHAEAARGDMVADIYEIKPSEGDWFESDDLIQVDGCGAWCASCGGPAAVDELFCDSCQDRNDRHTEEEPE